MGGIVDDDAVLAARVAAATSLQTTLAAAVTRHDDTGLIDRVTGVDVAYVDGEERLFAAAATLDATTLEPVETVVAEAEIDFPYIPGLFSFRELPAILSVLDRLALSPQLVVCDGQGIAHPRRLGLASHLGVITGLPTIGCAKSRLIGTHGPLPPDRGARVALVDGGEVIGAALRTQSGIRPVYVSIGHRVSLETACGWVIRLSPQYRLPETTRVADHVVRQAAAADALSRSAAPDRSGFPPDPTP